MRARTTGKNKIKNIYEQDTVTGYWALEAEARQCCIKNVTCIR